MKQALQHTFTLMVICTTMFTFCNNRIEETYRPPRITDDKAYGISRKILYPKRDLYCLPNLSARTLSRYSPKLVSALLSAPTNTSDIFSDGE